MNALRGVSGMRRAFQRLPDPGHRESDVLFVHGEDSAARDART
jgi:hypothetical protein